MMLDAEFNFFWRRWLGSVDRTYIHVVEYDYLNLEKGAGDDEWEGMVKAMKKRFKSLENRHDSLNDIMDKVYKKVCHVDTEIHDIKSKMKDKEEKK